MVGRTEVYRYAELLAAVVACGLVSACASSSGAASAVQEVSARSRAQQVYDQVRLRTPPSDWSGASASAFPEAPEGVVRPLERLAASRTEEEEAAALEEVSEALEATGYYSRVFFKSLPNGAKIKYRPIARKRTVTAHVGWNSIAIGFYYVWAQRGDEPTSTKDQYDIIAKQVKIFIREEKPKPE